MSECPVCQDENMNKVWRQEDGVFISICSTCEALSMIEITETWEPPIEAMVEEVAISVIRLIARLLQALWRPVKKLFRKA